MKPFQHSNYAKVLDALFSLRALDKFRKRSTKQIADKSRLQRPTVRQTLKELQQWGLVERQPDVLKGRAFWISRYVTGKRPTSYNLDQYLSDAAKIQSLAQEDAKARAMLGTINLAKLDVEGNKDDRKFFNAIVKALTKAGHKGLPTYETTGGSFFWWLKVTSRAIAYKVVERFTGQRSLP